MFPLHNAVALVVILILDPTSAEELRGCASDEKICSDGSHVTRTLPGCEFERCPEEEVSRILQQKEDKDSSQTTIAKSAPTTCRLSDFRTCPDGTVLTRQPPTCEFDDCPLPKQTDVADKTASTGDKKASAVDSCIHRDAKLCPDGSFVTRTPPLCEFICPEYKKKPIVSGGEQQPQTKPEPKPDTKPEPKPEPEAKPAPLPEPEAKPAPLPETRPATKPEPTSSSSTEPESRPADKLEPEARPAPNKASGSGDPHFKTWNGDKYDYHGECDLILIHNPDFANGLGLRVHIRTTQVQYFSFIEKVAVQIGLDTLEFDNDVENFLINGIKVEENRRYHKTYLGGFLVRRDPNAISIRLRDGTGLHQKTGAAKIDLHTRRNGFPAVIVDGGNTDIFKGSLGLLGDWATGKRMARDGKTEMNNDDDNDATAFALEWQVRDTEPMLFSEARFPQYPTTCTPPAKRQSWNRLGVSSFQKEAEEACAHWKEDKEDCIFDVIATRDILVAAEGHIVHIE